MTYFTVVPSAPKQLCFRQNRMHLLVPLLAQSQLGMVCTMRLLMTCHSARKRHKKALTCESALLKQRREARRQSALRKANGESSRAPRKRHRRCVYSSPRARRLLISAAQPSPVESKQQALDRAIAGGEYDYLILQMADVMILEARAIEEEMKRVMPYVVSHVRPSMLASPGELRPDILKSLRDLVTAMQESQRNGTYSEAKAIAYHLITGTPVPPGLPNNRADAAMVLSCLGVAT